MSGGLYIDRGQRGGPSSIAWVLLGMIVAGAIGGVLYYAASINNAPPPPPPPPRFAGNAVWLGVTWANEPHAEDEIKLLAAYLRDNHIQDAYVYTSYLRVDSGEWNETFGYARKFVSVFKEAAPELRVLSWLGVPADDQEGVYRLDDEGVRAEVAEFAGGVVERFGFDGVHLNVETIFDGDADLLALLEAVRGGLDSGALLSATVPPDWNPGLPEVPAGPMTEEGFVWSQEYKQEVAARVDQLALMTYNSGLESAADYEAWTAYQVEQFSAALARVPGVGLVVGVPTYDDDEPPGHFAHVENLRTALRGVNEGLAKAGEEAGVVVGVGLYTFWETDALEWALYRRWLNP